MVSLVRHVTTLPSRAAKWLRQSLLRWFISAPKTVWAMVSATMAPACALLVTRATTARSSSAAVQLSALATVNASMSHANANRVLQEMSAIFPWLAPWVRSLSWARPLLVNALTWVSVTEPPTSANVNWDTLGRTAPRSSA